MYQLVEDSQREQATKKNREKHVAIQWDRRDSENQPETIGDSERHASTPCDKRDSQ